MADNNPFPGENNTGHIWDDDLRELKNPPPRWWTILWWVSLAWCVVYAFLYPTIPFLTDSNKGFLNWTQIGEYKQGLAEVNKVREKYESRIATMSAKEILADAELTNYISHGDGAGAGKVLFGDNCAACHGSAGQGTVGFPVLADDDWIWGGTIEKIAETITNGRGPKAVVPSPGMPAHGGVISKKEIAALAKYVVGLSEGKGDAAGKKLFTEKGCIGCHGVDGKGMAVLGSVNLTDAVWRFDEADRVASASYTIEHGVNQMGKPKSRQAEMPTFGSRLSADDVKKLAVYVYKFGGGK
ncbi:MAG: cytochrome-c oxidase, cbb3-type subunit III [Gammaproteobacteria bacterium]|nr:cytochrome-c oxidase, cbb3-type subunit III [Gammaproteobacteria bacterium]